MDPPYSSPFLYTASLSRTEINLDIDTNVSVPAGGNSGYRISISVEGKALLNSSGTPSYGLLNIFRPNETSPFVSLRLELQSQGGDTVSFSSPVTFLLQRSDAGPLGLEFLVQTAYGRTSNTIRQTLMITRRNSRPKIVRVSMPDSITIGHLSSPDSTFLIAATVSDSDGIADIAGASFISKKPDGTFANNGSSIPLFDDGSENVVFAPDIRSGDAISGDGIFSIRVRLVSYTLNFNFDPPETTYTQRGIYTFKFSAFDKSGALSDTVAQEIKVK